MNEVVYRYVIEDQTGLMSGNGSGIKNGAAGTIEDNGGGGKTFLDGAIGRSTDTAINRVVLNPLNSATGGLATPVYNVGKRLLSGASAGAVGGAAAMAAIAAIQLAVTKIQERIAKNEAKAAALNEQDNVRLRAGSVSQATYYTGGFKGVKSRTDRA